MCRPDGYRGRPRLRVQKNQSERGERERPLHSDFFSSRLTLTLTLSSVFL